MCSFDREGEPSAPFEPPLAPGPMWPVAPVASMPGTDGGGRPGIRTASPPVSGIMSAGLTVAAASAHGPAERLSARTRDRDGCQQRLTARQFMPSRATAPQKVTPMPALSEPPGTMIGVTDTTEPAENEVAGAPATPEEWRVFLERYGELYVKLHADDEELADLLDEDQLEDLDEGKRVDAWLGAAPAREEALTASEERLGMRFPPGLRGFFLTSDGWTCLDGYVDGVHPCDRVVWMRDSQAGGRVIETYASIPGNEEDVALFRRSIEIARGEDFWLLDPTDVGPDGEWAAYEFTPKYGDTTDYPSFSALFHSMFESMEEEDDDEDMD